jgi:ribonucleoside-diphosphate reductase alpha chain
MTGRAYAQSARIAAAMGPYDRYAENREAHNSVMRMHRDAAYAIDRDKCPELLWRAACEDWDEAVRLGQENGYRNAQATVLAPTGTIGLLMDCDTTGIEPDFALVKFKKLAGGGYFKIVLVGARAPHLRYRRPTCKRSWPTFSGTNTLGAAPP